MNILNMSSCVVFKFRTTPKDTQQKYYIMKPQFKPEEIYIDLSKLSEEQQERVMCVTGITIEWIKYAGYLIYHKGWKTSNKSWLKDQNLTELTYIQFLEMMGESEEKSKVIENSEKELINNDGTIYIGEGLENYYKDQLERTGKFKVVSIDATSEEVLQVENILKYLANRNNELAEKPCFENVCRMVEINRVTQMIKSNQ